jgi:spermidine synthase
MGAAALATLPIYGSTFNAMQWALGTLRPTESGYAAFNLLSHALCLAVMFPAAFCAGMTLPLITVSLLRSGAGERAIGQVYAANTLGAIVGVAGAVHLGLPLLGTKGLIIAGAVVDLALGVLLLGASRRALAATAFAGSAALVLSVAAFVPLDAHKLASGVFRHGQILDARQSVLFHEDGKTATISVTGHDHGLTLRTNGKPDGSVRHGSTVLGDERTQVLLGALPLYYAPQARRIATIGFGTGVTAHVLLGGAHVEVVDTVEIEPAVVRAAPHFLPFNERALSDPRSRVHFEDAKTFFSSSRASYDVIVSEPSNPWVSGVSSLFTDEFYGDVRRYVREGGLFVQWLHLYETTPVLVASVLEAMRPHFSDYAVWAPNEGDLVIVAVNGGRLPRPDSGLFRNAGVADALGGIGIRSAEELAAYRVAGRRALAPYFASFGAPPNSDFQPFLDVGAARARFMGQNARELLELRNAGLPLLQWFDSAGAMAGSAEPEAVALESYVLRGDAGALGELPASMRGDAELLRRDVQRCRFETPPQVLRLAFMDAAFLINARLPAARAEAFWALVTKAACMTTLAETERRWLRLHAAIPGADPRAVVEAARAVLEAEPGLADRGRAYALAAYMAGSIRAGDAGGALKMYGANRTKLTRAKEWQPVFRFLIGHMDHPQR